MVKTRRRVLVLATGLVGVAFAAATIKAQDDQHAVAQRILAGSEIERSKALENARALGPQKTGSELRAALIRALEREGEARARRYEAGLRGEAPRLPEDPEFILGLSRVVAELRDPAAIPALIGALGTGEPVTRAVVAFGEEAVPSLLAAVESPKTMHGVVDEALVVLRFLAEGAGPRRLSTNMLDKIRHATKQRLTGRQYFTVLWSAIDLAVTLGDPELRRIVRSLASDRGEVVGRGIEDPETIEETQRLAAERLAKGVPPELRWR